MTKDCTTCGATKQLNEFVRNAACRFGRSNQCKSCAKAYKQRWATVFKSDIAEKNKKYHTDHREEIHAKKKAYYEKNKAHTITKSKIWAEANREKSKAIKNSYRNKNKVACNRMVKAWKNKNAERVKAKARERIAKLNTPYVRNCLGMTKGQATDDVVQLKRQQLTIMRMARSIRKGLKNETSKDNS